MRFVYIQGASQGMEAWPRRRASIDSCCHFFFIAGCARVSWIISDVTRTYQAIEKIVGQITLTHTPMPVTTKTTESHLLLFFAGQLPGFFFIDISIEAMSMFYHLIFLVLFAFPNAMAFTSSLTTTRTINTALQAATGRRAFVQGVASAAFFATLMPAFAVEVIDDLAMPTQDEDAKAKEVCTVYGRGIVFSWHPPLYLDFYRNVLRFSISYRRLLLLS